VQLSSYGYICCRDCRQQVFLGKWLRSDEGEGFGFWHAGLGNHDQGQLGAKALTFMARHLAHDVRAFVEGSDLHASTADFSTDEDDALTSRLKPK
jgi:hypothetical protein